VRQPEITTTLPRRVGPIYEASYRPIQVRRFGPVSNMSEPRSPNSTKVRDGVRGTWRIRRALGAVVWIAVAPGQAHRSAFLQCKNMHFAFMSGNTLGNRRSKMEVCSCKI